MANLDDERIPNLQPPGAGLPLWQRILLRWVIGPFVSTKIPPSDIRKNYESLNKKLIDRISSVPTEQRSIRVLVEPMMGLEDSSRFWSINGVLEHLLIVSEGVEAGILMLSSGRIPNVKPDIAAVKPKNFGLDMLPRFVEQAPSLLERIDVAMSEPGFDFYSPLALNHPWFGPMTARQWYWLLSAHQVIHYKQVKAIIKALDQNTQSIK